MTNVPATIYAALKSFGLNDIAIAGAMGNLEVESGFDTGAYNGHENAVGIAQWEGVRLTALQQYAAAHGGDIHDLNIQLGFLHQELLERNLIGALNSAGSTANAATIWDEKFEVSSGSTRAQRIQNASSLYGMIQNGQLANGNYTGPTDTSTPTGGNVTPNLSGNTAPAMSAEDYESAANSLNAQLGGLLNSIPELKKVLQEAVAGSWTTAKFQQAIQGTQWYKTHADTVRTLLALKASDPATYQRQLQAQIAQITQAAAQMGVTGLAPATVSQIAYQSLAEGWTSATIQHQLASYLNLNKDTLAGQGLTGQYAALYQQLQSLYSDYGVPTTTAQIAHRAKWLLAGNTTIDTYKQDAINNAKSLYPSLASQLDEGMTVKDIASPYVSDMANILEVDPNNIGLDDPTIKKALQGTTTTLTNGQASTTTTPLWQFEQQLRSDPRWQYTSNAKSTVSQALVKIGSDFGFST